MKFHFEYDFDITEESMETMVDKICNDGWDFQDAIGNWAWSLNDDDFYHVDYIRADLEKELQKRVDKRMR